MDDNDAHMKKVRISLRMQRAVPTRKEHRSRFHRGLTLPVFLVSLLACSASAMDADVGLPGLPRVSGSADTHGSYGPLPEEAKRVLSGLGCSLDDTAKVLVAYVPGEAGNRDVMVTDTRGTNYRYWLRSFSGSDGTVGYLVQLNGCPVSTDGMRAYIARGSAAPQDVTASVLAKSSLPDAVTMASYTEAGVSDLAALTGQLDTVPVVRWVAEPDVDRPIAKDARTFDHTSLVHAGFLVWEKDRFTFHWTIPASLWPCSGSQTISCNDDPFVKGP